MSPDDRPGCLPALVPYRQPLAATNVTANLLAESHALLDPIHFGVFNSDGTLAPLSVNSAMQATAPNLVNPALLHSPSALLPDANALNVGVAGDRVRTDYQFGSAPLTDLAPAGPTTDFAPANLRVWITQSPGDNTVVARDNALNRTDAATFTDGGNQHALPSWDAILVRASDSPASRMTDNLVQPSPMDLVFANALWE